MTTKKLNQADIDFLTIKIKRTVLTYKASLICAIVMIPTAVFLGYAEGFSGTIAFLVFGVIGLVLNSYVHHKIAKDIEQDIKNDVKELSEGTITDTYFSFGKGFIVDRKNYVMDEFSKFEVGEIVLTESVPISRNGLKIKKIRK